MIKQQFEQLKNLRNEYSYKDFEVINDKTIKKFYYRKDQYNQPNLVVEECHEFYVDSNQIIEVITESECYTAIFDKKQFALADGANFGDPITREEKHHDNVVKLAFRFGQEFEKSFQKFKQVKWLPLAKIVEQLEYILLKKENRGLIRRQPDRAIFSFQNEYYLVTHTHQGFLLHERSSPSTWFCTGEPLGIYKTAMDLVLAVGIEKFQFGIESNGGD